MAYNLINNPILQPLSEVIVDNKNVASAMLSQNIYPVSSGTFGVGVASALNEMNFVIGSNNCAWIPNETELGFDLALGSTGFTDNAENPFRRVRILTQSGTVLVDSDAHNLIGNIIKVATIGNETKANNWESGMDGLCVAGGVPLTTATTHFNVRLSLPFLDQVKSLALPIIGNLRLIITMETDLVAFPGLYAPQTYALTSPVLNVKLVPYKQDYLDRLVQLAKNGGYVLNYSNQFHMNQICSATDNTITVNYAMKSCRNAFAVCRLPAEATLNPYNKLCKFLVPGTSPSYQWQQGSDFYPSSVVDDYPRAFVELKKVVNTFSDVDGASQITRARWSAANITASDGTQQTAGPLFIMAGDFTCGGMNTGISTVNGSLSLRVRSSGTANMFCDVFCIYDSIAVVYSPSLCVIDQ